MTLRLRTATMTLLLALTAFSGPAASSTAPAALHLQFHMGASSGGQAFIGGTLLNAGVHDLAGGFIAVSFFTESCQYSGSEIYSFNNLPADAKHGFRIPVRVALHRYQITGLNAYDTSGKPVAFIDDNSAITDESRHAAIAQCAKRP